MNLALWTVDGLLCARCLRTKNTKKVAESKSPNQSLGLSKGLVTFIGISELAGAAGIILPLATGVAPVLTTLAALGFAIIMVLASIYHRLCTRIWRSAQLAEV
jgi:DoxX-like protein